MLLALLCIAVVAVIAFYVVGQMKLPEPINRIVLLIVGAILLLVLLSMLGGFGPWPAHWRAWP